MSSRAFNLVAVLAVCTLVTSAGLLACEKKDTPHMVSLGGTDAGRSAAGQTAAGPTKDAGPMVRIHASSGLMRVSVEVARTNPERRQGLMYRSSMGEHAGMVFLFDQDENHRFWMKNTLLELDMIFITKDMKVAGVVHRAAPRTLTHRGVGKLSRYVLEVNGGYAEKAGITTGDTVEFESVF